MKREWLAALTVACAAAPAWGYVFEETTSGGQPIHWADQQTGTPTVINLFYDFRSQNGFANAITPAEKTVAQQVLSDLSAVTGGRIAFSQNTVVNSANIINIGVGNLQATGGTSGAGGTLGQGGGSFGSAANSFSSAYAWMDSADEPWDTTQGNGNPTLNSGFDFYTVAMHEVLHALGLGHSDNSFANIMTTIDGGEKLGPAQDDIAGLNALYAVSGTDPTPFYTALTRSFTTFSVGVFNQYDFFYQSGGVFNFGETVNSCKTTVTGATTIYATTGFINPSEMHLDGGQWTTGTLVVGTTGSPASTMTMSAGTLTVTAASNAVLIDQLGSLTQSGGSFSASGMTINSSGSFSLNGGTTSLTQITVSSGGSLSYTAGALSITTLNSAGTATLWAAPSWASSSSLLVSGGITTIANDSAPTGAAKLSVTATGGLLSFTSVQHVKSLSIGTAGDIAFSSGLTAPVQTNSVVISPGGILDLADNDMIVHSSAPAADYVTIRGNLQTGRASGAWNGAGIQSTFAAGHPELGFGIVTGADWAAINPGAPFDGQTVSASDILLKFTYAGDADLNGTIGLDDYAFIDAGFFFHYTGWLNGDFNYDGVVNYKDYAIIDASFGNQGYGQLAADMIALHESEFGTPYMQELALMEAAVPEPASALLIMMGSAAIMSRARRRKTIKSTNR